MAKAAVDDKHDEAPITAANDDPLVSEQVTYLPGEEDPARVQFAGHHFHANLPLKVTMPKSWFEKLRGNKFFKVGPFDPAKDSAKMREEPRTPRTSDEYKAYAVAWFKSADNLHDFDERWVEEETLRQECGVGADDLDYLSSLSRPKRAGLKKKLRP